MNLNIPTTGNKLNKPLFLAIAGGGGAFTGGKYHPPPLSQVFTGSLPKPQQTYSLRSV